MSIDQHKKTLAVKLERRAFKQNHKSRTNLQRSSPSNRHLEEMNYLKQGGKCTPPDGSIQSYWYTINASGEKGDKSKYPYVTRTLEECKAICSQDNDCTGFQRVFRSGQCYFQTVELKGNRDAGYDCYVKNNHECNKSYSRKMRNTMNYEYLASLYVGTHLQEMTFLLDTGSSWTWIPNKDCPVDMCTNDHYNQELSTSYQNTGKVKTVTYVIDGQVKGNLSTDDFSPTPSHDTAAKGIPFLSVFETKYLNNLQSDGLLGLSPKGDYDSENMFVNKLKKDNVIDDSLFSIKLGKWDRYTNTETNSAVQFGGWDSQVVQSSMKHENESDRGIKWVKLLSENHWMVKMQGAMIDEEMIFTPLDSALFDSGTNLSYIPKAAFKQFIKAVEDAGKECEVFKNGEREDRFCQCTGVNDDKWPVLKLTMGNGHYSKQGGGCTPPDGSIQSDWYTINASGEKGDKSKYPYVTRTLEECKAICSQDNDCTAFDEIEQSCFFQTQYVQGDGNDLGFTCYVKDQNDQVQVWVEGKDYLEFYKEQQDCMIRIRGDLHEKLDFIWLLGIPFLQTYMSIYDLDRARVGLVRIYHPDEKVFRVKELVTPPIDSSQTEETKEGNCDQEKEKDNHPKVSQSEEIKETKIDEDEKDAIIPIEVNEKDEDEGQETGKNVIKPPEETNNVQVCQSCKSMPIDVEQEKQAEESISSLSQDVPLSSQKDILEQYEKQVDMIKVNDIKSKEHGKCQITKKGQQHLDYIVQCSSLSNCQHKLTQKPDNSNCQATESCASWFNHNTGQTQYGCIQTHFCGMSGVFRYQNTHFNCPNCLKEQSKSDNSQCHHCPAFQHVKDDGYCIQPECNSWEYLRIDGQCQSCGQHMKSSIHGKSCVPVQCPTTFLNNEGHCQECPPFQKVSEDRRSCIQPAKCNDHQLMLHDRQCQDCKPYTRSQLDGKSCHADICQQNQILLKDGTCKDCHLFTRPTANKKRCKVPRCALNEMMTFSGQCIKCKAYHIASQDSKSCQKQQCKDHQIQAQNGACKCSSAQQIIDKSGHCMQCAIFKTSSEDHKYCVDPSCSKTQHVTQEGTCCPLFTILLNDAITCQQVECNHNQMLKPSGQCHDCPPYTKPQANGRQCGPDTCVDNIEVLPDGSCGPCHEGSPGCPLQHRCKPNQKQKANGDCVDCPIYTIQSFNVKECIKPKCDSTEKLKKNGSCEPCPPNTNSLKSETECSHAGCNVNQIKNVDGSCKSCDIYKTPSSDKK